MTRTFRALLLSAALIATPLLTSCNDAADPISAAPTIERQDGLIGDLLGGIFKLLGGILVGPDANGEAASAWIGPAGGTVTTAAYTLVVPANAVSKSTRFDVKPTNTGTYSLDLHAYQKGGLLNLSLINVSSQGFAKPVTLKVSYAKATNVTDPQSLAIFYVRDNGTIEIQTSIINTTTKTVSSPLSHFSKYALAQN